MPKQIETLERKWRPNPWIVTILWVDLTSALSSICKIYARYETDSIGWYLFQMSDTG